MADRFIGGNAHATHEIGDTTEVVTELNNNNTATRNVVNAIGDQVDFLSGSGALDAADAASNIPNLLANGDFLVRFCGGVVPTTIPPLEHYNDAHAGSQPTTFMVKWVDSWYFEPTEDLGSGIGSIDVTLDKVTGEIVIEGTSDSSYTGALTGFVFQRVDYFTPMEQLRGRPIVFAIQYSAVTDGEFTLEVDDGVATSSSTPSDHVAAVDGQAYVTHVVDPLATRLVVKIVLNGDADYGSAALRVKKAYARVGVGVPTLPQTIAPHQLARDIAMCRTQHHVQYHKFFHIASIFSTTERARHQVDCRIFYKNDEDVKFEWQALADLLVTTLTAAAVTKTLELDSDYDQYDGLGVPDRFKTISGLSFSMSRPAATLPADDQGFSCLVLQIWVNVIPPSVD